MSAVSPSSSAHPYLWCRCKGPGTSVSTAKTTGEMELHVMACKSKRKEIKDDLYIYNR